VAGDEVVVADEMVAGQRVDERRVVTKVPVDHRHGGETPPVQYARSTPSQDHHKLLKGPLNFETSYKLRRQRAQVASCAPQTERGEGFTLSAHASDFGV
jgi:hypothetical protein